MRRWKNWIDGKEARPFQFANEIRNAWNAYLENGGKQPAGPHTVWVERLEDLCARGYDLTARNPHQTGQRTYLRPYEITARMMERVNELHQRIARLHQMVSEGMVEAQ